LEVTDLALGALALPAILLLQLAGEVFTVAFGDIEDVVGELAPPGLGLALQLGPPAGDDVLVHGVSSCDGGTIPGIRGSHTILRKRPCRRGQGFVARAFTSMSAARVQSRISVDLPNRLSTRSTARRAVRLRRSSAGFTSTTSSESAPPASAIISIISCASR